MLECSNMRSHSFDQGAHAAPFLFGRPLWGKDMPVTHENVQDTPLWMLIGSCLIAALAGELHRASELLEMSWVTIVKRIALRYLASAVVGSIAAFICVDQHFSIGLTFAVGMFFSLAGADAAIAIYTSFVKRRLGVCDVPGKDAQP